MKEIYFEGGPLDDTLGAVSGPNPIRMAIQTPEPDDLSLNMPMHATVRLRTRVALYQIMRFAPGFHRDRYNAMHPEARKAKFVARFDGWEDEDDTPTKGGDANE